MASKQLKPTSPRAPEPGWDSLRTELIRALRNSRSQNQVNRRLGFSFNQMSRWESGRTRMLWTDFVRLCEVCHKDIRGALHTAIGYEGDPLDTRALVTILLDTQEIESFAHALDLSRFVVSRWLHGKTQPSLEEMLKALHRLPRTLFGFLNHLVDPAGLPSVARLHDDYLVTRNLERSYPETAALLRCLELAEYLDHDIHPEGFISQCLGISLERERHLLDLLERAGSVKIEDGKYTVTAKNIDTRGDFVTGKAIRRYWQDASAHLLDRQLAAPTNGDLFGYLVYSVSEEKRKEIEQRYLEFFHAVRKIVTNDNPRTSKVQVMLCQFFEPRDLDAVRSENEE